MKYSKTYTNLLDLVSSRSCYSVQLNGSKEAELHVLHMIQDGDIHATINQKDGIVVFQEDPEEYKTGDMVNQIDFSIQRLMALSNILASIDDQMSCDPGYLTKFDEGFSTETISASSLN